VRRDADGVELRSADDTSRRFDAVVVATHADQALRLLEDPSPEERNLLGAFAYTRNEATLHTDASQLPTTSAARASWNYRVGDDGRPTITYYLNRLQRLATQRDWCVTLNGEVAEEHVVDRTVFEHPLFTVDALAAQRELPRLAGVRRTTYAGAYHGYGFHEDGLASGVRAAESLGASW
jgi:predicted NAD/FAD-binding protein